MENGGPFRGGPKPEQVIQFRTDQEGTEKINKWLAEHVGTVEVLSRETVFYPGGACFVVLFWYRERE